MITIKDIAKICKVSKSVVSRAFNSQYNRISSETRSRILEVAKKLNYQPNIFATALRTKRVKTIGLIIPNIINPFFAEFCENCEQQVNLLGHNLILCITGNKIEKEYAYLQMLYQRKVDGIIIIMPELEDYTKAVEYLIKLQEAKISYVIIGNIEPVKCDKVNIDDIKSGEILTRYLLNSGYKKIIYAYNNGGENFNISTTKAYISKSVLKGDRLQGIKKVLNGKMIEMLTINEIINKLSEIKNKRTAIIAANDFLAIEVWRKLNEYNIKIPKHVGLSGFDNIGMLDRLNFPLTTIDNQSKLLSDKSVEFLFNRINQPKKHQQIFTAESKLVIRKST